MFDHSAPPILSFRGPMGIPVNVVPSFLMLALIFMMFDPSLDGAIFFGLVVVSIFLHELGHAWGCRVQGVPVTKIVLWGGGGLCFHRPEPDPKRDELIVAMGPIVNLAIWAVASLSAQWGFSSAAASPMVYEAAGWLWQLAWINLFLFGINMLPVSPLDGGRLFYLWLRRLLPMRTAGRAAGVVGTVIAVAWVPAMIYLFMTYGVLLFFMPSIGHHLALARGDYLP
ncbi:site-2 protease family protein [Jannaschia marina]|uniref:site-2 protease family protein n=1 Tax=Jannaschia marina TaxID=2741674 RepID=UPI0015C79A23|nr:site-2 protease family protein [Jannaschia marina]